MISTYSMPFVDCLVDTAAGRFGEAGDSAPALAGGARRRLLG